MPGGLKPTAFTADPGRLPEGGCLSLIGVAGAGKSTVGRLLAESLGWAHLDTDRLLESWWGLPLEELLTSLGPEKFKVAEEQAVSCLNLNLTIISTGGSVVYSDKAVARLKELGPVVYLSIPLEVFLERVGLAQGRGFLREGGKSMEEVYAERIPLYEAAADRTVDTSAASPEECVRAIIRWLEGA